MKGKIPLHVAQIVADKYIDQLRPRCDKIQVAGSVRRRISRVGDIEIVCIPKTEEVPDGMFNTKMERVSGFAVVVFDAATEITKGNPHTGRYVQFMVQEGIQIDLFMLKKETWGRLYMVRTGSADFSKWMAERWVKWGYKAIEGVLWKVDEQKNPLNIVHTPTEKSIFDLLGLKVIPPTKRNQRGLPS